MTVSLVQSAGADTGVGTAASLTVTLASGATAGNLLIAAAISDATITTPSGWTLVDSAVQNQAVYLWYKIAAGGETSVVFTPSVTDTVAAAVLEYSGLTATPLDVSAHALRSSSSAVTVTTGTTAATAQAIELVVAVAGPHSFSHLAQPGSPSWVTATNRVSQVTANTSNPINCGLFVSDYTTAVAATQSETCTFGNGNSSQDAGGIIAAFKAASGGAVSGAVTDTSTATITATGTNAAAGGATETVTAGVTATGANAAVGGTAPTFTAGFAASGVNAAVGAAAAALAVAITATAVAGSTASVSTGVAITAEAQVTSTQQQGSWWQLLDIRRQARVEFELDPYVKGPPSACPRCGEPLLHGPPSEPGIWFCTFDGWQYPRDWSRPEPPAGLYSPGGPGSYSGAP